MQQKQRQIEDRLTLGGPPGRYDYLVNATRRSTPLRVLEPECRKISGRQLLGGIHDINVFASQHRGQYGPVEQGKPGE